MRSKTFAFVVCAALAGGFTSKDAFAQFETVLDRVRQGADQINANNPTYYLKSAKAVEPNICLYSNGDPTGIVGPLVFRNSYVAAPNCREFKACTDVPRPVDEPRPSDCGAEVPNSRFWSTEQKPLKMRSDGNTSVELISEEFIKVRTCTETPMPVATCTTGKVGLFRAEVEYEYPSGYESRYNWDRFQNLAGKTTETRNRMVWLRSEEAVKTGNQKSTRLDFVGQSTDVVPPHAVSALVSHKYGDQQATIEFQEENPDLVHFTRLKSSSEGAQQWEISTNVNRRRSPPVTRVGFMPSTFAVSIEDKSLPDLLSLPGGDTTRTKYLITVFTEKSHRDETLIFQTETENTGKTVLFSVKMDPETLHTMKGKSKKVRVHVRAQRIGSPWVDGEVSPERVHETEKAVKFANK